MRRVILGTLIVIAALTTSGFAQTAVPGIGIGQTGSRPRRRLTRNTAPALSPALNLVPGANTSFEGQFLLRQLPQEQFDRATTSYGRQIEGLQNKIKQNEVEIKTGIGKTGHSATFLNYGNYYSFGASRVFLWRIARSPRWAVDCDAEHLSSPTRTCLDLLNEQLHDQ